MKIQQTTISFPSCYLLTKRFFMILCTDNAKSQLDELGQVRLGYKRPQARRDLIIISPATARSSSQAPITAQLFHDTAFLIESWPSTQLRSQQERRETAQNYMTLVSCSPSFSTSYLLFFPLLSFDLLFSSPPLRLRQTANPEQ